MRRQPGSRLRTLTEPPSRRSATRSQCSPRSMPARRTCRGLVEELAADRGRQGLVACVLVSRFITESARELAGARGVTVPAVLEGLTAGLETGDAEHHTALDRALASVRGYAEALDDLRPPGTVTADLDASLGPGPASCRYLIALTQIAHEMITAHCAETGEDVASYLQRVSLPAAGAHGNAIDADAAEGYAGALIGDRLAAEPLLLNVAAQALRRGTLAPRRTRDQPEPATPGHDRPVAGRSHRAPGPSSGRGRVRGRGDAPAHPHRVADPGDPAAPPGSARRVGADPDGSLGTRLSSSAPTISASTWPGRAANWKTTRRARHLRTEPGMGYRYQP